MAAIKIEDLGNKIMKSMQEYASSVKEDVKKEAKKIASETVEELKKTSPEGIGSRKGHYKDGWTSKTEQDSSTHIGIRIYNKKKPGLTHLLEKGHAKRGGGRVEGIPHIEPAEKNAIESYEKRLKERLKK